MSELVAIVFIEIKYKKIKQLCSVVWMVNLWMPKWIEGVLAHVCYSARWSIYMCQTFGSKEVTNDKNCTHPKEEEV